MEEKIKVYSRAIVTRSMGRCQCGDCFCVVYEDGSIQYDGSEYWQCSKRILKPSFPQTPRDYESQLKEASYQRALNLIRRERARDEEGFDLVAEAEKLRMQIDCLKDRLEDIEGRMKARDIKEN